MKLPEKIKSQSFFIKLLHWEYWPVHVVYTPIYPVWIWYCIKARSLFFFGASNPTIKNAGFLMESKKEIDALIPEKYKPLTLFFPSNTAIAKIKKELNLQQLPYPLIVKPDIGLQGKAVVKVNNDNELNNAINQFTVDYIIQPFIPYPKELGIFYVRYPNDQYGKITGIVEKEFLTVKGDGICTIEELLKLNPRHILQIPVLRKTLGQTIHTVIKKDKVSVLVPYGNHVRGSLFLDSTGKVSKQLETLIDKVCQSIEGFYYGRLDIRFNSYEELQEDKNWCIIELNGAGSEPTHMYDPKHSILFAWKEIIRHWKMLYKVSMQNKRKGYSFLTYKEGITMFKANNQYVNKLNKIYFEEVKSEEDTPQNLDRTELKVV